MTDNRNRLNPDNNNIPTPGTPNNAADGIELAETPAPQPPVDTKQQAMTDAEKAKQKQLDERRKLQENMERLAYMSGYKAYYGVPTWLPSPKDLEQEADTNSLRCGSLVSEIAGDGTYRCAKYDFAIVVKDGSVRTDPPPHSPRWGIGPFSQAENFKKHYTAVIDFLASAKGARSITIDFKKGVFDGDSLKAILKIAESRHLAVVFGPNIKDFLEKNKRETLDITPWDLGKTSAKERRKRYRVAESVSQSAGASTPAGQIKSQESYHKIHLSNQHQLELSQQIKNINGLERELTGTKEEAAGSPEAGGKEHIAKYYDAAAAKSEAGSESEHGKFTVIKERFENIIGQQNQMIKAKEMLEEELKEHREQLRDDPTFTTSQEKRMELLESLGKQAEETKQLREVWQQEFEERTGPDFKLNDHPELKNLILEINALRDMSAKQQTKLDTVATKTDLDALGAEVNSKKQEEPQVRLK